jgi:hypothetical protein
MDRVELLLLLHLALASFTHDVTLLLLRVTKTHTQSTVNKQFRGPEGGGVGRWGGERGRGEWHTHSEHFIQSNTLILAM